MDENIKRYADSGDLKALKYIFLDSLDVDPTFEYYADGYDYCKSKGLLEKHVELTPFLNDPARWTENYWVQLKTDLQKNFSDRRMQHMRDVAKVYMKEKCQRLIREREAEAAHSAPVKPQQTTSHQTPQVIDKAGSKSREQARQLEEERRRLAEENRRFEESQQQRRDEQVWSAHGASGSSQQRRESDSSKKALGVALAVVAIVVLIVVVLHIV